MSELKKSVVVSVRGIYKYPKKEDGKFKVAISIPKETSIKIQEKVKNEWDNAYILVTNTDDDINDNVLVNASSKYVVPAYDVDGNDVDRVYHGAEVVAKLSIKEYNYKGKKGITSYLMGIVVEQNGLNNSGTDFKSIMNDVL